MGMPLPLSGGVGLGGLLAMEGLFALPGGRIREGGPGRAAVAGGDAAAPLCVGSWQQPLPRELPDQALGWTGTCLFTARDPPIYADTIPPSFTRRHTLCLLRRL